MVTLVKIAFEKDIQWLSDMISLLIPMSNFTKSVMKVLELHDKNVHCFARSAVAMESAGFIGKICRNLLGTTFSDRYTKICARKFTVLS